MITCYICGKQLVRKCGKVDAQCKSCRDDKDNWKRRYSWNIYEEWQFSMK